MPWADLKRHFQVDTSGGTGPRSQINVAGNCKHQGKGGDKGGGCE